MTTATRNEAAARLRHRLRGPGVQSINAADNALIELEHALAAERRATVEPFVQLEKRLWADADAMEASDTGSKKARAIAVESLRAAAREVYATRLAILVEEAAR